MGNAVIHQRISESIYAESYNSPLAPSDIQYYSTNYKSTKSSAKANSSFPKPRRASHPHSIIRQNLKDALKLHQLVHEINSRNQTRNSQSILAHNPHLNYGSAYSSARYTTGDQNVMSLSTLMHQNGIDSSIFRASPAQTMSAQRNLPNNENLERSNHFRHDSPQLALQDRSNSSPHIQNQHQTINKAYKAMRSSRRQDSGRDKLPTIEQLTENNQQISNPESNISSLNNTEERPMKRRICFKSKSANKYPQKPTNFNAQDFLNELENLRTKNHCSPNDSQSIPPNHHPSEECSYLATHEEDQNTLISNENNHLRSRPPHHQNIERTPSPNRIITQENNTQSSGKASGPAVKHRVLLNSNMSRRSRDREDSANSHRNNYGIKAFSPSPNGQRSLSPFQDLRNKSPLDHSQRETSHSPFKETPGKYSSAGGGVYTQILSKHYDLSDVKHRFHGSGSKRLNSSSPSPNDKRRPMQSYEQPTLSQVQRINFSNLGSATKSSLYNYTDDEERREDRLIPIQQAQAIKKPNLLAASNSTKSINVGDFNIDTRQLLLSSADKKAAFNMTEETMKKRSRSSSPLHHPALLSSSYNSNLALSASKSQQQETCNNVLSDINLKIEGILQKCCELTEKSAKGLEKLNSSRTLRKTSGATVERPLDQIANTANTVNTQDTARDTARDLVRMASEESTAEFRRLDKNYWSAASIDNGDGNSNRSQRVLTEEQPGKEFEDVLAEDRMINKALSQRRKPAQGEQTIIEEEEEASKDMMYLESQKLDEQRYNSSPVHNHEGVYSVYSDIVIKEPTTESSGLGQLMFTSEQSTHLMSFGSLKKANFRSRKEEGGGEYLSSHIYTDEQEENTKQQYSSLAEQNIAHKVEAAMSSANSLQQQVNAKQDSHFQNHPNESITKEKLEKEISTAVHELESISKVLKNLPQNKNEQFVSALGLEQVQEALMQKIGDIHEDILGRIDQLNQKIESKSALSTRRKSSAAASHISVEPMTKPNTKTEVDTRMESMNISGFEAAVQGHQSFLNQSSMPKPDSSRSTVYIQSQTLNHSTHQDQAKAFEPVLTFGSIKGPSYKDVESNKKMMHKSKSQHKYEPKQVKISIPKIMEHATSRNTTKTNRQVYDKNLDHMAMLKDVSPISHKTDMLKGSLFEDVSLIGRSGRSTEKGSISHIKRDASTNTEKTVESLPVNEETPKPKQMPQVHMFSGQGQGQKKMKKGDLGEKKWSNDKLRNGFSKYMKTIYGETNFPDASLVVQTEPGYDELNGRLTSVYEERYLNLLNRELRQKNLKRYNNDNSDYHDLAFEKEILAAKYHTFAQYEEKDSSQPEQQSPSPEHTIKSEDVASEKKKLAVDLMSLSSLRRNRDLETPDDNVQKLEEWLENPRAGRATVNIQQQHQQNNNSRQQNSSASKGKSTPSKDHKMKVLKIQNLIKQAQGKPVKEDHHANLFYTEGNEVEEDLSWLDASHSRINRSSVLSNKISNYDPNRSNSRDNGRLSVTSSKGKSIGMVHSVKKGESGKKGFGSVVEKNSTHKSTDRRNLLKNVYLESLGSVSSFEVGRENRGGFYETKSKQNNNKVYTPEKNAGSAKKIGGRSEKKMFSEKSEDRIKSFGMIRKY